GKRTRKEILVNRIRFPEEARSLGSSPRVGLSQPSQGTYYRVAGEDVARRSARRIVEECSSHAGQPATEGLEWVIFNLIREAQNHVQK
ncbi:MAG: hypothetical protein ACKO23_03785, partial [Gemmataceae bacterium]